MTYPEQLLQEEWRQKSQIIKKRDNFCCIMCGRSETIVSVEVGDSFFCIGNDHRLGELGSAILTVNGTWDLDSYLIMNNHDKLFLGICPVVKDHFLFGVTDKGALFGSTIILDNNPPRSMTLFVSEVTLIDGQLYRIIHQKEKIDFYASVIPILYAENEYVGLNVHHKYYVEGKLAWQYDDRDLITLCSKCHNRVHTEFGVQFFTDESKTTELKLTPCCKCGGAGYFPQWKHIENGVCFRCRGMRFEERII